MLTPAGLGSNFLSCIGRAYISGSTSESSPIPVVLSIFSLIGIGCLVRLCRVKSAPFFSVAEKRSLPPAFKNYEVRGAAGTMDPLTPNRVAFPGLAGLACRS